LTNPKAVLNISPIGNHGATTFFQTNTLEMYREKSRKRLMWELYPSQLALIFLALIAITWYGTKTFHTFFYEQTASDLKSKAYLLEDQVASLLARNQTAALDAFCKNVGSKSSTRITVISPSGVVLADSDSDPATMENHADRPEVMAAMQHLLNPSVRFSHTLKTNMMYVAIPLTNANGIIAVLRTAVPTRGIEEALGEDIYRKIATGLLIIALLAALGTWFISRRISRPLEEIKNGAERFAKGDFSRKLIPKGPEEIAGLAERLNKMAEQLDERISTIIKQRNELEAVFSNMVEGVITVDMDERFISINRAGAHLIGVDPKRIHGRSTLEVIRNSDLQRFVKKSLSTTEPVEGEIILTDDEGKERFLHSHGVLLKDSRGRHIGALIVINDVTNLRRLENVRRDFVANVSHELKTPITSIKGFVETLLDGALNDPEDAKKFLEIVAQQANRLNAIVEDLLALSRIEQEAEKAEITLTPLPLQKTMEEAYLTCQAKAFEKNTKLTLHCPDNLIANINPHLLEQALVNLVENAIKYSPGESEVTFRAEQDEDEIRIKVEDNGPGIAKEHQPRIFERFYRVDKARSSKIGGTGLGLAIVKYIVQSHKGHVDVVSKLGKGTTFTIHLPKN